MKDETMIERLISVFICALKSMECWWFVSKAERDLQWKDELNVLLVSRCIRIHAEQDFRSDLAILLFAGFSVLTLFKRASYQGLRHSCDEEVLRQLGGLLFAGGGILHLNFIKYILFFFV